MVRKLTMAIALVLGTASAPLYALGLGDINSRSALNQNFDADIDLLSVAQGELDAIRVSLATADAYERSGVERPSSLFALKFSPQRLEDGRAVVRVTSEQPIREPFLNFLIEVNWPRGRLVREYTVLLDPPTTAQRRPPQVSTPRVRQPAMISQAAPVAAPESGMPRAVQAPAPAIDEYGPIRANETLWGIARQVKPRGVTMEQMMVALLQSNPQAFIDNNINRMRKGQILRIPGRDEVLAISREQARQTYRSQQDQWLEQRARKMQAAGAADGGETEAAAGRLKIVTARPDAEGKAGSSEIDASAPSVQELEEKLLVAGEIAESSKQETATLRSQVEDLGDRLMDMQKLILLKDEQLARLQDQVAARGEVPVQAQVSQPAPPDTGELSAADLKSEVERRIAEMGLEGAAPALPGDMSETAVGALQGEVTAQSPAPVTPPTEEMAAEAGLAGAPGGAVAVAPLPAEEIPPPAVDLPQAGPAEAPARPVETPSVERGPLADIGDFIERNLLLLGSGAGVLALLLALLMVRRNRARDEDSDEVGPLAGETAVVAPVPGGGALEVDASPEPVSSGGGGEDTSFLSEFSPSDINALQDETGEVDPVSEADVYIAYGRYTQAEELLKQAISKEPEHPALKHKLLEVYYATRNSAAFLALATAMADVGQDSSDSVSWARVRDMGRELLPDEQMFADSAKAGGDDTLRMARPAVVATQDEELALDDLELSALASDLSEDIHDPGDAELDISLDLGDLSDEIGIDQDSVPVEGMESLDLDLPELDSEQLAGELTGAEAARAIPNPETTSIGLSPVSADSPDSMSDLDSELDNDELKAQLDELSDLSVLDADLSDMIEESTVPEQPSVPVDDTLDQPISLDEVLDMDLGDEESITLDELEGFGVEESDEVATKLDLARAYVEMGDRDGARSILGEVRDEGNAEQKGEAEKLLGSLD